MRPIEFEIERTIRAPIERVFARLVDIEGHNDWLAGTGSMLKRTRQTTPGEPRVGTTFVDETSQGTVLGEIVEMEAPHTVVFHWWDKSRSGRLKFEGWPSYRLEPIGDDETLVRHRGKLESYGVWRLGTPVWRRFAVKERTTTVDALKASFEQAPHP
ncbi:SRPBCC family protein [Georgenia sp. H159]|uniref:SRPBCC family protein n=1 Tax=Georgenia sp. H159 TaxID=3076115 RepID=UPI002D78E7F7|nr:SRPBCC family protein [Georgenia sp. H159]